jgi:hypothetical protein
MSAISLFPEQSTLHFFVFLAFSPHQTSEKTSNMGTKTVLAILGLIASINGAPFGPPFNIPFWRKPQSPAIQTMENDPQIKFWDPQRMGLCTILIGLK